MIVWMPECGFTASHQVALTFRAAIVPHSRCSSGAEVLLWWPQLNRFFCTLCLFPRQSALAQVIRYYDDVIALDCVPSLPFKFLFFSILFLTKICLSPTSFSQLLETCSIV